ncbi:FadR/GntR family transcriptional regulator [Enemella sp. A6]|uniref:FadR/GntR family transcriptional regulator n=1 Tax=Enemella sp. A6 TaxID=3440152 RepID=UPI003EBCE0E4
MNAGLHGRVLNQIGAELTGGELTPGAVFSTEWLMQRYGVSRTIARGVIKVLEQHGVLTSRRRVGLTVQPSSNWDALSPLIVGWRLDSAEISVQIRELSELRSGIEPVAARLAATRATPEQRARLLSAVGGMAATGREGDLEAYLDHDITFHTTLLESSGNAALASLAPLVSTVLDFRTHRYLMPATPDPDAVRWHFAVAEAISIGDGEAAAENMQLIVQEAQHAMQEAVEGTRAD